MTISFQMARVRTTGRKKIEMTVSTGSVGSALSRGLEAPFALGIEFIAEESGKSISRSPLP